MKSQLTVKFDFKDRYVLESRMMGNYHVRFGKGANRKEKFYFHLKSHRQHKQQHLTYIRNTLQSLPKW